MKRIGEFNFDWENERLYYWPYINDDIESFSITVTPEQIPLIVVVNLLQASWFDFWCLAWAYGSGRRFN